MDGLVLSVAIGFRSYGGDGVTEWIAVVIAGASFVVMFFFTLLIYLNFRQDTRARNSVIAQTTLAHAKKLTDLLYDPSLEDVRLGGTTLKEIYCHYEKGNELPEEHSKYFSDLEDLAYNLLLELEATNELIEQKVIDKKLLKSYVGLVILNQYAQFFEPLVKIGIKRALLRSYPDPWSGIIALIDKLKYSD